jgi:hypothetical protein
MSLHLLLLSFFPCVCSLSSVQYLRSKKASVAPLVHMPTCISLNLSSAYLSDCLPSVYQTTFCLPSNRLPSFFNYLPSFFNCLPSLCLHVIYANSSPLICLLPIYLSAFRLSDYLLSTRPHTLSFIFLHLLLLSFLAARENPPLSFHDP